MVAMLAEDPVHEVWVFNYGISMGRWMVLGLLKERWPPHTRLIAYHCHRFSGALEGGPYRLAIDVSERVIPRHLEREDVVPVVRLYDVGGAFELVCESIGVLEGLGPGDVVLPELAEYDTPAGG
ncbi:MAG TPA: hypothetical protein VM261_01750 [Kofleriaceae bacterium]|nr:hypothetical protein [Kofleriaceae bacterium]